MTAAAIPLNTRWKRQVRPQDLPFRLLVLRFAFLTATAAAILFPLVIFVGASLKSDADFLTNPIGVPRHFLFSNYVAAWHQADMGRLILNSLLVSVVTVVLTVLLTSTMAYGLTGYRFRGRQTILFSVLVMVTIPAQIYIIPLYVIEIRLNLIDTYAAVILPYTAGSMPLALVLFRNYFLDLPAELSDAARLDGCTRWGVFRRIVMPLSRPAIGAVSIFTFVNAWNEFFLALVFLQNPRLHTLPLGMQNFAISEYQTNYPLLFAAFSIGMAPMIAVYLLLQRQFVAGLSGGALKG